ncbi:MAG: hypothetical protein ACK40X_00005, partial [Armatimonadota bacterium]
RQIAKTKTTQELVMVLEELLTFYANDKNSSTLREWAVLQISGCAPLMGKIGYNGHQGGIPYEVKPRNVLSSENKRLNGGGNFTDFTYERLEKYLQDGVHVLVAGFVDGNLVYVLEVPFACLYGAIKAQLDKKFHSDRPTGMFLRSANFSFHDYAGRPEVRLVFLHRNWQKFANWLTRDFRRYLEQLAGEVS